MTIMETLTIQLVQALRACPELDEVKTMESTIRVSLFTGNKLSQGFQGVELPAINVSLSLGSTKSRPFTTDSTANEIPAAIVVVCRGTDETAARDQAEGIASKVAKVLNKFRRSGNPLGLNTFVTGDITRNPASAIFEQPYSFSWVTVDATILKIVGDE